MDLGLSGKACLVTGSTGGIGLETARLLVAEGARVVTCGRGDAPGIGETLHVRADLAEPGAPATVVDAAAEALGGLDVLVNNVGFARPGALRGGDRRGLGRDVAAERDELRARDPRRAAALLRERAARS